MSEQSTVTFRPISRDNFIETVKLSVHESQRSFVASNVFSIAQAKVEPAWVPLAVYAGDELVGFTMYGYENEEERWWVIRLMIGAEHQGKGYGEATMRTVIREMVDRHGMDVIMTSYDPGNDVAASRYRKLGFRETGEIEDGEIVAEMRLNQAGEV